MSGNNVQPDYEKTVEEEARDELKDPGTPEGFDSVEEFLEYAVTLYNLDLDADNDNRLAAIEDSQFATGKQWEDYVEQQRKAARKPTLTLNQLPSFIGQLFGNRRLNETEIKVSPDDNSDKAVARVREGLIRSIQKKGKFAYDKAYEGQVIGGMGNFKVELKYASDDVFEQDIVLCPIPNPLSVVWDKMSYEPTGEDAKHCFIVDSMTEEELKRQYPDIPESAWGQGTVRDYLTGIGVTADGWYDDGVFRVVEFWRMRSRKRLIALLKSDTEEGGEDQVEDITDVDFDEIADRIVTREDGTPIMREADRKYAEMYIITCNQILEGPYELPIKRVPVFRAMGWDINVGETRRRFGLVRFMKDPQRLLNYWRSVVAEKLMATPKGNWIAADTAVQGRETEWRNSHLTDDPLLVYNANSGLPPERVSPAQLEPALIEQAGMAKQDLYDISNMHQASLGMQSNEVSGRAIRERVRVGEVGTVIYETNLNMAIEAAGGVINDLIPIAYDTKRTIKILGEDGKELPPIVINDTVDENSVDITTGKYSVTMTSGPSYATKRAEAQDSMLNMVNAVPQTMAVALDKIVEASDWPGASEIAARLRTQLPPGVIQLSEMTPEEQQAYAAAQQAQQAQQQREDMVLQADLLEKQSRAEQSQALAQQAMANAAKTLSEVGIEAAKLAAQEQDNATKRFLEGVARYQEAIKLQLDANRGT